MSTFNINQTPDDSNLVLYPTTVNSGSMPSYGASPSYECINDLWNSHNEDIDYLYVEEPAEENIYFDMQNHTTESGTINFVKIVGRAKSYLWNQKSTGSYKFYVHDGSTSSWSPNKAPVSTNYANKEHIFYDKPSTGDWTWNDIDNLVVGLKVSSPSVNNNVTGYIYPSSVSWESATAAWNTQGETNKEDCVNEPYGSPDDDNSYITRDGTNSDCYEWGIRFNMTNMPSPYYNVSFNNVKTMHRCSDPNNDAYGDASIRIYDNDGSQDGSCYDIGSSYENNWDTFTTDSNSDAWTETTINQICLQLAFKQGDAANNVRCTQILAKYDYDINDSPEIRTTQIYVIVNYTPSTVSVNLTLPNNLSVSHSRKINRFTFPAGDYEVADYGRSGKTLSISGTETSDAYSKMQDLKDMVHYGSDVTISDLPDTNLNTDYLIKSFDFVQEPGEPNIYHWNLVLEEQG